jgi:hypothetical protein
MVVSTDSDFGAVAARPESCTIGDDYFVSFLAYVPDAHGAAPDGGGVGRLGPDGVLRFSCEDSFSNRGAGSFRRTANGSALSIHIDDVHDPRCMMFYGEFTLQPVKPNTR